MSFFSRINPTPAFPEYSGPYKVGTCDCEFPVDELESPSQAPDLDLPGTVSFRIFYPCEPARNSERPKPVHWLPSPQRGYLSAYAQFLGANSTLGAAISYFPQLLYHTTIPVVRNAPLMTPEVETRRWPVMIFSHGLGGSRNAYSYIVGNLASHGIVVIAPDHRDESAPASYIRATSKTPAKVLGYQKYSHTPSKEVYDGRDKQLKTRLWEMGLIHDAVTRIDRGDSPRNLDPNPTTHPKGRTEVLDQFKGQLEVQKPGSIIWAGHSFGACTVVQLLKSTYHRIEAEKAAKQKYTPLFAPHNSSSIVHQITPKSTVILLDIWCLPLRSPATRWLWNKPMPAYAEGGAGGKAILSILSEAFFKWTGNLNDTKRVLAPPKESKADGPYLFYPSTSAHLSQSDFGILFPWLLKKVLKVEEPERIVRLNVRAALQVIRNQGFKVADTSNLDLEIEETSGKEADNRPAVNMERNDSATSVSEATGDSLIQDPKILLRDGSLRGWVSFGVDDLDESATKGRKQQHQRKASHVEEDSQVPGDVVVDDERGTTTTQIEA